MNKMKKNYQNHLNFFKFALYFKNMETNLQEHVRHAIKALYSIEPLGNEIIIERTRQNIEGDYTLPVFMLSKRLRKKPADTAKELGVYIKSRCSSISSYNVLHGFLNIKMQTDYWIDKLNNFNLTPRVEKNKQTYMIEFSSPNTNKPLHLGHVRNNLLGDSIARILSYVGINVIKANLVNDRGIHICKSMLAWQKWGEGASPEQKGIKPDKFVGEFYVLFDKKYKQELAELQATGLSLEQAETQSQLMQQARKLLLKWEAGDEEVLKIWKMMNDWAYKGFDITYESLNIHFDKIYYESQTYIRGKKIVEQGLEKEVFYKENDGSIWINLEKHELDKKILLRSDGTTVYMTQDLGTIAQRFDDYNLDRIIYVVGNEQDYHFNALKCIYSYIDKLNADKIYHLSYGMVELPEGKMKSREGTVVDADDLILQMIEHGKQIAEKQGKINQLSQNEQDIIIKMIAVGALKYYMIKVAPQKQMLFNPNESIDFNGNTGPFIQYTYARICSILRNAEKMNIKFRGKVSENANPVNIEIELLAILASFEFKVQEAANKLDPSIIANFVYELAKTYNQYYHEYSILKETNINNMHFKLLLSQHVANTINVSMGLLGIQVPEIM